VWQSIVDLEGIALLSGNWPAVHLLSICYSFIGMPPVLSWGWLDERADLPHTNGFLDMPLPVPGCHCHGLTHDRSASYVTEASAVD
jgi:hypothetical protein